MKADKYNEKVEYGERNKSVNASKNDIYRVLEMLEAGNRCIGAVDSEIEIEI